MIKEIEFKTKNATLKLTKWSGSNQVEFLTTEHHEKRDTLTSFTFREKKDVKKLIKFLSVELD